MKPPRHDPLTALLDDCGMVGALISRTFDRMRIAEQMIAAAKAKHARRWEADIDRVFRVACPPEILRDKSDALYRWHVSELIDRARANESPSPGTRAEIVAMLSDTSIKAPLVPRAQLADQERRW